VREVHLAVGENLVHRFSVLHSNCDRPISP
jgi:hypothetical protein